MKMKVAVLIGAFILLCGMSLHHSLPYFHSGMSTQTAHVLTSLRSLHDWGFFRLRGVSTFLPRSSEMEDLDFGRFTSEFDEAVYLSYPSGWLALPYAVFVLTRLVAPQVDIGPAFLFTYNIVVDRVLEGVLLLFFLSFLAFVLTDKKIPFLTCGFLALSGLTFWFLSPPVLYWTQNAYGMDQAIVPCITALLLLVTWKRCRLSACTRGEQVLLFFLVFLCCSVDWYGWVAAGIGIAACLAVEVVEGRHCWRALLRVYALPLLAAILAGAVFFFQLLSYPDGFRQLVLKYGIRSAHSPETEGMLRKLGILWVDYLPKSSNVRWVFPALLCAGGLIWKSRDRLMVMALGVAIVVPPFLWTFLLPEHSAVHEFSLFKFVLPTAVLGTCLLLVPVLLCKKHGAKDAMLCATLLVYAAYVGFIMTKHHIYQPLVAQDDVWTRPIQTLMEQDVRVDDLPLSDVPALTGSRPPHKLWYANRRIYPPAVAKDQLRQGFMNPEAAASMHPVYFKTEDRFVPIAVEQMCAGLWQETQIKILNADIFLCRSDALRSLYL